jgi:hypothetical protein
LESHPLKMATKVITATSLRTVIACSMGKLL